MVPVLKNESVPAGSNRRGLGALLNLRQALVVAQIALSLISLVAAGLFLRSLRESQAIDPGFETRGVLVMNFNLGREGYTPARGQVFSSAPSPWSPAMFPPGARRGSIHWLR